MASQWTRIADSQKRKLLRVAKNSFSFAGKKIIRLSPVDTGRFKENWLTAIGEANTSIDLPSGFGLTSTVKLLRLGDTIFFTNSLPYAFRLEFGWSGQAPMGMVRITLADWQGIVDREVKKVAT
jgi:hypothetical protein